VGVISVRKSRRTRCAPLVRVRGGVVVVVVYHCVKHTMIHTHTHTHARRRNTRCCSRIGAGGTPQRHAHTHAHTLVRTHTHTRARTRRRNVQHWQASYLVAEGAVPGV
jgi:hypothetical protein